MFSQSSTNSIAWSATFTAAGIALLALLGWAFDVTLLKSISPEWVAMSIVTAICFLLVAGELALLLKNPSAIRKHVLLQAPGVVAGLVGLIVVVLYAISGLTSQALLITEVPLLKFFWMPHAKPALVTATLFLFTGSALPLLASGSRKAANIAHVLMAPVAAAAYLVALSYLLGVQSLHDLLQMPVALNTGVAFCAVCIAIFFLRPDTWLMGVFTGDRAGSVMARRLLPVLLMVPPAIGWLRLYEGSAGIINPEIGVVLGELTYTVLLTGLVWLTARAINRAEDERRESEERYRSLVELSPDAIAVHAEGKYVYLNPAGVKMFGASGPREIIGRAVLDVVHPEERDAVRERMRKIYDHGIPPPLHESKLLRLDGLSLDVEVVSTPITFNNKPASQMILRNITERKQAEEKLRESEERQRAIFDNAPAAIYVKDRHGRYLLINRIARAWLNDMRKSEDEILGRTDDELFSREIAADFTKGDRKIFDTGVAIEEEDQLIQSDGVHIFLEHKFPLRNTAGEIYAVAGIASDITDRKRAEQEMRAAGDEAVRERLRLQTVLDTIPSGLLVYDAGTAKITLQNLRVIDLFGSPIDAGNQDQRIQNLKMSKPDGSPFQPHELPGMRAIRTGETIRDEEMLVTRSDGRQITVLVSAAPLRNEAGDVTGCIVALNDITQRKQVEEDFGTILRTAMDGFWIVDSRGRFLDVNDAYCSLSGYCREELLTMTVQDVEARETAADTARHIELVKKVGHDRFETCHKIKSNKIVDMEVSVNYLQGSDRMFVFLRDITERKRAEKTLKSAYVELERRALELDAANRELDAFSYTVSHDLKAPLRSIDGFATAVLEDYAGTLNDTGRDYLQRVHSASQRMAQLIDAMLQMARVTKRDLFEKTVDLGALARTISRGLQKQDAGRKVTFIIGEAPKVHGDEMMLNVLIENLLHNAWKFTSKHEAATIEFGVTDMNGQTVYFVRDDGAGFDMQYADKLFYPFKRLHSESEFPGIGIGLAIAHRIVSRHGGRIWAEGEPGKGATFYFTL